MGPWTGTTTTTMTRPSGDEQTGVIVCARSRQSPAYDQWHGDYHHGEAHRDGEDRDNNTSNQRRDEGRWERTCSPRSRDSSARGHRGRRPAYHPIVNPIEMLEGPLIRLSRRHCLARLPRSWLHHLQCKRRTPLHRFLTAPPLPCSRPRQRRGAQHGE